MPGGALEIRALGLRRSPNGPSVESGDLFPLPQLTISSKVADIRRISW